MKKKVLSLVLALLMTASAASTVLANDDVMAISEDTAVEAVAVDEEVEAGQYDKAIEFLANYKIFKGYNADDTGADDPIERYQMALFVARISTGWVEDEVWEDGPENWSEFSDIDVDPVNKYYGALSYANQKGIIEGYGNGKFGPQDHITYQNALTMVVRTLGYTNLDWPWGYIQKAVELGLTDGITGVAYTDELTRGEVAQIIYNALFATTKSGTTLGLSSFGIEFGWEKIIVTASDLNIFVADNEKASKGRESGDAYTKWNDSKKTADGYVAFQLLNDDGSLGDDTYYVKSTDLGLAAGENNHDDEAVVGEAYYVLFEKDENSDLAKVVAYESLKVDTLWNEGKTDDDGDAQDYDIKEFLKENTIVTKYTTNEYINTTKAGKPEVMVFNGVGGITEEYVAGNYIAIDWETGDILEPVKDANGNFVIDKDGKFVYDVAWNYNPLLEKYYRYVFDEEDAKGMYNDDKSAKKGSYDEVFGIDYMTDAEFEKYYASLNWTAKKNYKGFAQAVESIADSAYASLELFDTNLDGVADRGIYESYRLGYFSEANDLCGSCGGDYGYKISDVKTIGLTYADKANKVVNGEDVATLASTVSVRAEGTVCTHDSNRGWFVEGYTPVVAYDEDGEADGYEEGYVIYNYDEETGAIKVVKCIEDGSDDDSFVKTGVLRAYNLKNGTVTIGDDQYYVNAYDELEGNAFKYVTKNWLTRACYTGLLRDLFNQFVEYVVVDGELVAIRAKSATKNEVIIVDSYAGLSSDGYIVVNGYSSADLEYTRFRIGSYDGWMKGDYYYYLTEEKAKASFDKGAIYAITSYDAANDVYYVELAGEFEEDDNVLNYVVDSDKVKLDHAVTITADGDGYMTYTTKDGDSYHKMSDSDTYVIIPKQVEGRPYATIKVYTGKLDEDWKVSGNRINGTGKDDGKYVIINAEYEGFYDTYNTGLVLLLSDKYVSASYNGTDAEDWYLLGATEIEVEVFDLFTGNEENVILPGTNLDLEVGHVYFTQDGNLVEDLGALSMENIIEAAVNGYDDDDRDTVNYETAKYFFGTLEVTDLAKLFTTDKDAHKAFIMETKAVDGKALYEKLDNEKYRKNLDSVKIFAVEYEEELNSYDEVVDYTIKTVKAVDSVKAFNKVVDTSKFDSYKFYANYVYDIAGNDIVIYITAVASDYVKVESTTEPVYTNAVKVKELDGTHADGVYTDAYVEMSFGYTTETTTTFGEANTEYILETIKLAVAGKSVEEATHAEIRDNGWYFGAEGIHFEEDNEAVITIGNVEFNVYDVYASIVDEALDCDECNLVMEVVIPVNAFEVVDGVETAVDFVITDETNPTRHEVEVVLWDGTEGDGDLLSSAGTSFKAVLNWFTTGKIDKTLTWNNGFVTDYVAEGVVFAHLADQK